MTGTGILPKKAGRIALLVGWMGLIFLFSADGSSGEHSGSLFHWLCALFGRHPDPTLHFWLRKGVHFTEYAILFGLWQWNLGRTGLSLFLTVLYAGTDEFHQAFVPHRGPSLRDVGVDSLGALTALGGRFLFRRSGVRNPGAAPSRGCRRPGP